MECLMPEISSVYIPENLPVSRMAPRPAALRQPNYEERYDYKMLFADIFRYNDKIILSGPPLLNLKQIMETAKFYVDFKLTFGVPHFQDIDRTQNSYIHHQGDAYTLSIDCGWIAAEKNIQPNYSEFFRNSKVLFTMSKDNDLQWIRDWCEFYIKVHGVDSILLYDNNSETYTINDIVDSLKQVSGLQKIAVVNFPIKYGLISYNRSAWDSDFAVYIQLQHARYRFLSLAAGVINADIDELVLTDDGRTVFDYLQEADNGYIRYKGIWVEPATEINPKSEIRHRDCFYILNEERNPPIYRKWSADFRKLPEKVQARVHECYPDVTIEPIEGLHIRHFKGISTGWKRDTSGIEFNPDIHKKDELLYETYKKIGWV